MTSGEVAELYVGHELLKSAYEYLGDMKVSKAERIANADAMLIMLDARALIQEELVNYMFGQGDGYRC